MHSSLLVKLLLIASFGAATFAQAEDDSQNIADMFNVGAPSYTGGYFSPVVKATNFLSQDAYLAGARLGLVFSESLLIGAAGYKLFSDVKYDQTLSGTDPRVKGLGLAPGEEFQQERDFEFSYGAAYLGWTFFPRKVINLTFLTNIGWGAAKLDRADYDTEEVTSEYDKLEVIEPELLGEVNITKSMRAGLGYSYRFVRGLDFDELSLGDLQGGAGILSVTFHEGLSY